MLISKKGKLTGLESEVKTGLTCALMLLHLIRHDEGVDLKECINSGDTL